MKSTTTACMALLTGSRQAYMVELYTITLATGQVLRYSAGDSEISFGGVTWILGPLFKRGRTRLTVGIQTDTMSLEIKPRTEDSLLGLPWRTAARNGALSRARVLVQRGYAASPQDPILGLIHKFEGRIGAIQFDVAAIKTSVVSDTHLLDIKMPRHIVGPGCDNNLFDSACGVNKAAFSSSRTASSGSTQSSVVASGGAMGVDYYALGEIVFTSGPNSGSRRTIKGNSASVISLSYPLPSTPGVGDAFTITPGCDKQVTTCQNKFANKTRFRGLPYVPVAESAV